MCPIPSQLVWGPTASLCNLGHCMVPTGAADPGVLCCFFLFTLDRLNPPMLWPVRILIQVPQPRGSLQCPATGKLAVSSHGEACSAQPRGCLLCTATGKLAVSSHGEACSVQPRGSLLCPATGMLALPSHGEACSVQPWGSLLCSAVSLCCESSAPRTCLAPWPCPLQEETWVRFWLPSVPWAQQRQLPHPVSILLPSNPLCKATDFPALKPVSEVKSSFECQKLNSHSFPWHL